MLRRQVLAFAPKAPRGGSIPTPPLPTVDLASLIKVPGAVAPTVGKETVASVKKPAKTATAKPQPQSPVKRKREPKQALVAAEKEPRLQEDTPAAATAAEDPRPATLVGVAIDESLLRLLSNDNVRAFLQRVAEGSVNASSVAPSVVPATDTTTTAATTTTTTAPAATASKPMVASPKFLWTANLNAATVNGMSPWTAPFRFKPPFNIRGGCSFAAHHRRLLEALVPDKTNPTDFPVRWVSELVAASFNSVVDGSAVNTLAGQIGLAMPAYGTVHCANGGVRLGTADMERELAHRRTFHPLSRYAEENQKAMTSHDPPLCARCGETGKFFTREEVTDALLHHSSVKQYRAPYWITSSHPRLTTGYLELKPESRAVLVSNVALVFDGARIDAIPSNVAARSWLHPRWTDKATRRPGMNAFTGEVSTVPKLLEYREGWATLEQLIDAKLQIPIATATRQELSFKDTELDGGTFVELREFALYNADQLEKPGRLAVIRDEDVQKDVLFQPFH